MFAGQVVAGFVPYSSRQLRRQLTPLRTTACPVVNVPSGSSRWGSGISAAEMGRMHWTIPSLVVQIRFTEWTREHRLRLPKYAGLRIDKDPLDVRREAE